MAVAVSHNAELLDQITEVRTRWNAAGGSVLRLFQNNFTPNPASVIGDFTVASYTGYAEVDLEAEWSAPSLEAAGHYAMQTDEYQFDPPGSGGPNTIYGAYIVHDGAVVLSKRFDASILVEVGALPFKVRVKYTQKAESIV